MNSAPSAQRTRVLLVDDNESMRARADAVLSPTCEVIGTAADGPTAIEAAGRLSPDVIVLDISMPEMSGIEVARALSAEQPQSRILIMTVHEDRGTVQQVLDLGVAGYLVKRSPSSEVTHAIHVVVAGGTYIDPLIAGKACGSSDSLSRAVPRS